VTVPSFRPEVDRPIDLVEEFVRIFGTSRIPDRPVSATGMHRADAPLAVWERRVQDLLAARGFYECCHYSLTDAKRLSRWAGDVQERALALANPLTSEMSHLRASLLPGLLDALRLNQARGNTMRALFETGRVFRADAAGAMAELASVAFLLAVDEPRRSWRSPMAPDFYTARDLVDQLLALLPGVVPSWQILGNDPMWQDGHAASLLGPSDGPRAAVGLLATEMTKSWDCDGLVLAGELVFPAAWLEAHAATQPVTIEAFSDFPAAERDLALIVPEAVPAEEVRLGLEAIATQACAGRFTLEEVAIFDLYRGKGLPEDSKSLAFSLRFRSPERTLQDKEVGEVFDQVQTAIKARGYAIR